MKNYTVVYYNRQQKGYLVVLNTLAAILKGGFLLILTFY